MKKLLLAFMLLSTLSFSQAKKTLQDTLIKTPIYTSLYSKDYNMPRMVSYKLYKAGGECSRTAEGMHFRLDSIKLKISGADYAKSGYDMGHMANAEDFSYDCKMEELTFRFYNAVPQSPKSNRGVWKTYEFQARKASQTDSLFVMCGPVIDKTTWRMAKKNLFVPTRTWKVVYSLTTKQVLFCMIFDNDNIAALAKPITVKELEKLVKLDLKLH